tara:strand:+ start:1945 stop:3249 length:1305 start_codon:yes stop_codon:yes gene_type:complete
MKNTIDKLQLSLISKCRKYLINCKKKKIDVSISPFCDLNTWNNSVGYENLLLLKNDKKLSINFIWRIFLEIINIGRFKFLIFKPNINKFSTLDRKNIVYSYCWQESFKNENLFYDKFFNISSDNKKFHFILNSVDGFVPKNRNNFTIIVRKKTRFNLIIFVKYFFKHIINKNFLHVFNSTNIFNEFLSMFIKNFIKKSKINLIIPYENRPHQNAVLNAVKKKNKINKTICYLHNMPWPFQIDMISKNNNVDLLLTSSYVQKRVLINNYFWSKKIIQVIPSLRYSKLNNRNRTIFLPFEWTEDKNLLLNNFKNFVEERELNLKDYIVSIHPLKKNCSDHLEFKNKINQIINKNKTNRFNNRKIPIIFSHPGGTVTECLQSSNNAYHITSDQLNIFSKSIWKKVTVKEIEKNIYQYSSKLKFFEFKNKNYGIQKII